MPARNLILGASGYGKTYLAKALAKSIRAQGVKVLVCDPHAEAWPADYQTTDPHKLMALMKASQRCAAFFEEAGQCIGRGKQARDLGWITTGSRKWGHMVFLCAQRATMIELTIRSQCEGAYIFRVSIEDAKELAQQFAEPSLVQAATLPKREFLYVVSGEKPRRMKL